MKSLITAVLMLLMVAPVKAQLTGCQNTTGMFQLQKIRATASGTQIIGCINASFDALSASAPVTGSTTSYSTLGWIGVNRISGLSTGTVGVMHSSYTWFTSSVTIGGGGGLAVTYGITAGTATIQGNSFSVGTSSFTVGGGSVTVAYRLTAGNVSATGNIISNSSVSASGLFGATLAAPRINGPTTFFSSITIRANPGAISFSAGASTAAITYNDGDYNLNIYNTPNVIANDYIYNGIRLYNGGDNVNPKWVFERGGPLNIGNAVPAATKLDVNGSFQAGSGVTRSTISATGSFTLASGADLIGTSSITTTASLFGAAIAVGGSTFTVSGANGSFVGVGGTVAGAHVAVNLDSAGGSGTNQYGLYINKSGSAKFAATNVYGVRVNSLDYLNAPTNAYGFYVGPVYGTNTYGFYQDLAATTNTNVFGGSVGIGTSAPGAKLGVNGAIVGNSSVTASAFFGNGANLTGVTSTPGVENSSCTTNALNAGQTWTNTTFDGVGIAGSTLTLTTVGNSVIYQYVGSCIDNTTNESIALAVYQDGVLVSPQTSTRGAFGASNVLGAMTHNCSFSFTIRQPSAGAHSYYMAGRVSAGIGSLETSLSVGRACIYELK